MIKTHGRKSKIIAKIADNNAAPEYITKLIDAGIDVTWLNTAHQGEEEAIGVVANIRAASDSKMCILLDTKGPETRTKGVEIPFEVKKGDHVIFTGDLTKTGEMIIGVDYPNFHNEIPVGELISYDDNSISFIVEEIVEGGLKCVVQNSGLIKTKKSLNIPNVHINLPSLTPKDVGFIHFCAKNNIDFIIHSFVRNIQDLNDIKDILAAYPDYKGEIIAKIENREGFDNREEILDNCAGLMVARGDLMAEVPLEELPYMQKKMVESTLKKGKYCIVATQVLKNMVKNPSPTRAEVCDIGNAVLDGTHGISMSDETAFGDYPVEATTVMHRVMKYTEDKRDELVHFTAEPTLNTPEFTWAKEVVSKAKTEGVTAIVTKVSLAANKALSAYHPTAVVYAGTDDIMDYRNMALGYALKAVLTNGESVVEIKNMIELPSTGKVMLCEEVDGKLSHSIL
ncbi:MAG: pyruvate kinase [Patescibacteria group bacterium]